MELRERGGEEVEWSGVGVGVQRSGVQWNGMDELIHVF